MTLAMPLHQRKAQCTEPGMRIERDKVCKVSKKVSKTCEQTLHRQQQKWRTHMASMRVSETFENTIYKQEQKQQTHMASMRASETSLSLEWFTKRNCHTVDIGATE